MDKAVLLTQAILDKNSDTITSMLSDPSVKTWISNKVPTKSLTNHTLKDHVTTTSALDRACNLSSLSTVRALVEAGAELYNIDSDGYSALHTAAYTTKERMAKIEFLMKCDSDIINSKDNNNSNAAHVAAAVGHTDALQYLLDRHDGLKDEMDTFGLLPIHEAALNGKSECVQYLTERNKNINIRASKLNSTCLHLAAQEGHVQCIETLIRLSADPQLRDTYGRSALHRAACNGHTQCIDILVNTCKIDINAVDNDHETALYIAAQNGHLAFVRELLSYDDCNVLKSSKGKTAQMIAQENNHQRVAKLLMDSETTHELQEELRIKREHSALSRGLASTSGTSSVKPSEVQKHPYVATSASAKDTVSESVPAMTWNSLIQSKDCRISGQLTVWKDPAQYLMVSSFTKNKKKIFAVIVHDVFYAFKKAADAQAEFSFRIAGSSTKEYVGKKPRPIYHIFQVEFAGEPTFYFGSNIEDESKKWIEVLNQKTTAASKTLEYPVGLDAQGSYQKHLAPERATGIDTLGHEKLAKKMVKVLIESTQFDTPATIGIFAPWGSGKSRFLKFIKQHCEPKPVHFYLSSSDVNCCLRDKSINWCCKLFLYVLFSIVITVSTLTIIGFVIRNSEQTVQDVKCSNHSEIITNNTTTTTTTTQPCLPEISEPLIHYDFWSSAGICLAILLAILILFLGLCQRKVWQDCNYCYDEISPNSYISVSDGGGQGNNNKSSGNKSSDNKNSDNKSSGNESSENQKKSLMKRMRKNCCLDTRTLCYMSFFQPQESKAGHKIHVIKVDFNAWEYSGCDYLWAGIVTTLGSVVEKYFGKWTVRICRIILKRSFCSSQDNYTEPKDPRSFSWICCKLRHKLYVVALLLGYIVIVATAMVALIGSQYAEPFKESSMYIFITTSVVALGVLLTGFGTVIISLTKSTKSVVGEISKEMLCEDFKQELGFMHKIKQEVYHITKIINFMSRLYGCHFRVLLIIDDLDRCQPNRIMGILEAVNLLLEPCNDGTRSPYVSILAIDPRIVLGAIERHFDPDNRGDFSHANVNGYEYLKKIIHMPFCLPAPTNEDKKRCINHLIKRQDNNGSNEAKVSTAKTPESDQENNETEVGTADIPESEQKKSREKSSKATTNKPESDLEERQEKSRTATTNKPESDLEERQEPTEELLENIHNELEGTILLPFINGNPRTLKRICNVIILALSLFRRKSLSHAEALKLTLVVIMVEQWPFRTSFLHQYYMNKSQKRHQPNGKDRHVDDLVIKENYTGTSESSIDSLEKEELRKLWKEQQTLVMKIDGWKKYLRLDYDPELFYAFLETYRLRMIHLLEYLPYAVNHDTNLESIVEQGLAELDLKRMESIQPVYLISKKKARYESA